MAVAVTGCSGPEKAPDTGDAVAKGTGSSEKGTSEPKTAEPKSGDTGSTEPTAKEGSGETMAPDTKSPPTPPGKEDRKEVIEPPKAASGNFKPYVGKYKLAMSDAQNKMQQQLAKKGKATFSGTLDLRADGTFSISLALGQKVRVTEGTVQVDGKTISFTPVKEEGKPVTNASKKVIPMSWAEGMDGKRLKSQRGGLMFDRT